MVKYGFQSEEARIFPEIIILMLTSVCNMECLHCPHPVWKQEEDYRPAFIEWDLVEKALQEISQYKISVLRLTTQGEPLLDKRAVEVVRRAKELGIYPVDLTTNGLLLTPSISESLIDAGLDIIDVSLDAFTEEGYRRVRRNDNFQKIVGHVHELIRIRDEKKSSLRIMVSMIEQPETRDEMEAFQKYWSKRVDRVLIRTYYSHLGYVDSSKESFDKSIPRYPCTQFWKRIMIDWEGNLKFCVDDWQKRSVVGNLRTHSIAGVWRGELYERYRKNQLAGNYEEPSICKDCTDWAAHKWDYGFEHAVARVIGAEGQETYLDCLR
jgi:radical SAM protein with 4Fe4S-binding SPASM domain